MIIKSQKAPARLKYKKRGKGWIEVANKDTVALTQEQYEEIIRTMRKGGAGFRPNERIATILVLEANLGIRLGDILELRPTSIIRDGNRYRLRIREEKTDKKHPFTVPDEVVDFLTDYCIKNNIGQNDRIFPVTERNVQLFLAKVVDYLGYPNDIGTHSFRKFFATEILVNNNYNFVLVQKLLQHSSVAITQRYLGITSKEMEDALNNHVKLV